MLCGFSSLWWPFGWNWSYLAFLGIIWRTCGSKCRGEGGGIFLTLCVECCLVLYFIAEGLVSILTMWGCCDKFWFMLIFLAATKQLYKWYFPSVRPSVRPSVCLSHLFDYVPIIVSSWNFQELLPMTKVRSMQKVEVKGQGHRGHNPT